MTNDAITIRVRELLERRVSPGELQQTLERPLSEEEREDVLALARWFRRRYPTGTERLAYVRQAYARWQRPQARP
jgi:hypothetical protein